MPSDTPASKKNVSRRNALRRTQRQIRDHQVWHAYTQEFLTQGQIAERYGVSVSIINLCIKRVTEEYREQTQELAAQYIQGQLERTEKLIAEAYAAWVQSKNKKQSARSSRTVADGAQVERTDAFAEEQTGNVAYLKEIRELMADQRKLLGVDQINIAVSGSINHQQTVTHEIDMKGLEPTEQRQYLALLADAAKLLSTNQIADIIDGEVVSEV